MLKRYYDSQSILYLFKWRCCGEVYSVVVVKSPRSTEEIEENIGGGGGGGEQETKSAV